MSEPTSALQVFDVIVKVIEIGVIPIILYIVNLLSGMNNRQIKLETILIGADGKNGLRSRIRTLEKKVDSLALLQAARHGEPLPTRKYDDDEDDEN